MKDTVLFKGLPGVYIYVFFRFGILRSPFVFSS